MATPFTAEDQLVKRSLLSSIIGVANRIRTTSRNYSSNNNNSAAGSSTTSAPEPFDEHHQPCCSSNIPPFSTENPASSSIHGDNLHFPGINPYSPSNKAFRPTPLTPSTPNTTFPGSVGTGQSSPTTALGHQLDRQLDLNGIYLTPLNPQLPAQHSLHHLERFTELDPHEIYKEIVRECRELEHPEIVHRQGKIMRNLKSRKEAKEHPSEEEDEASESEERGIVAAALEALPAAISRQGANAIVAGEHPQMDSPTAADLMTSPCPFLAFGAAIHEHAYYQQQQQHQQQYPIQQPQQEQHHLMMPPTQTASAAAAIVGTGGLSLEHLVKIVVATVREVTGAAGGQRKRPRAAAEEQEPEQRPKEDRHGKRRGNGKEEDEEGDDDDEERKDEEEEDETAEQILERRRQQNNAAAARYRRRQRQMGTGLQEELAHLERRNWHLKTEMGQMQAEIDAAKAHLMLLRKS